MRKISRIALLIVLLFSMTLGMVVNQSTIIYANQTKSEATSLVEGKQGEYDVVVYGATSAGITSAIAAKKEGASVILIAMDSHLGGLTSSGLGATDMANVNVVGGISKEFYHRIYEYYHDNPDAWTSETEEEYYLALSTSNNGKVGCYGGRNDLLEMQWVFEPKVAVQVFKDMLIEAGVPVIFNERLDLDNGVTVSNNKIVKITTESGKEFSAKVFIDCSYEGDLMAKSGVTYTVGRESNSEYGETMNGILPNQNEYQAVSPFIVEGDPESGILPFIEDSPLGYTGEGDSRVQAYCFRFTLTTDPDNRVPITKPENYHPEWFETRARLLQLDPRKGNELTQNRMPNNKTDTNHADFVGMSYEYANGDYLSRNKIEGDHKDYVLGLLYFYAYDERVPLSVREEMRNYGLAKDEFIDNENFPVQIYLREGRRMVSDYVMSESDVIQNSVAGVIEKTTAPYSIGQGFYWFDSHRVAYFKMPSALGDISQTDGNFWAQRRDYPISYKSIVPTKGECNNIFVPVCLSATHAAYGSIRMETTYMIVGESAGTAAAMCAKEIEKDSTFAVQDLSYSKLAMKLSSNGQLLGDIVASEMDNGELALLKLGTYGLVDDQELLYTALNEGIDTEEEVIAVRNVFVKAAQKIKASSTVETTLAVMNKYGIIGNVESWKSLFSNELPKTLPSANVVTLFDKLANFFAKETPLGYISDWVEYFYQNGAINEEVRDYFDDNAISGKTCDGEKTYKLVLALARTIDASVNSGDGALKLFETVGITGNRALWQEVFEGNAVSVSGSNLNGLLKNTYKYMKNNESLWKDKYLGVVNFDFLQGKSIISENVFNEILKATGANKELDGAVSKDLLINSAKYFVADANESNALTILNTYGVDTTAVAVAMQGNNVDAESLKAYILDLIDAIKNTKIVEPLTAETFEYVKSINMITDDEIAYFIENASSSKVVSNESIMAFIDKIGVKIDSSEETSILKLLSLNVITEEEVVQLNKEEVLGSVANTVLKNLVTYVAENNVTLGDDILKILTDTKIIGQTEVDLYKNSISSFGSITSTNLSTLFINIANHIDSSVITSEDALNALFDIRIVGNVQEWTNTLNKTLVSGITTKPIIESATNYINTTYAYYNYLVDKEVIDLTTKTYFVRNGNNGNVAEKAKIITLLNTFATAISGETITDATVAVSTLKTAGVISNEASWLQIINAQEESVSVINLNTLVEKVVQKLKLNEDHPVLSDEVINYFIAQGFIKDNTNYNGEYFKKNAKYGGTLNQGETQNMIVRAFRVVSGKTGATAGQLPSLIDKVDFTFGDTPEEDATAREYWYARLTQKQATDGEMLRVLMIRIYDYLVEA